MLAVKLFQDKTRIEILKKLDTIDFKFAYQRAEIKSIGGLEIKVISLDDLILLKEAAVKGRDKERDREDLAFLLRFKKALRIKGKTRIIPSKANFHPMKFFTPF